MDIILQHDPTSAAAGPSGSKSKPNKPEYSGQTKQTKTKFPPIPEDKKVNNNHSKTAETKSHWTTIRDKLDKSKMGDGPKLEEIIRMRNSMKLRLTPRFQEWWDDQIEKKQHAQGQGTGRKLSLADVISHRRQEVSRSS